jgi:hypothetical protein
VSDRRTDDATLIAALRILASTIQTDDGVIPACLAEVATRLETLVEERRWIPVGERLPTHPRAVIANTPLAYGPTEAWFYKRKWCDFRGEHLEHPVTHWREMPPGPEVTEPELPTG